MSHSATTYSIKFSQLIGIIQMMNQISANNVQRILFPSITHDVPVGISMPNLAPDLRDYDVSEPASTILPKITPNSLQASMTEANNESMEPKKKKYAKEAWPGKRPSGSMLLVK
ncbi:unnamed protein product [Rotaria sp. Silwood1]|nr:unnamed protein product [Rotaria sp. Silwood1]